jgi:hypothetical protein
MRFVPAAIAAILLSIVGSVQRASAGTASSQPPKTAIFVANGYDVTAYPLGSNGDVPPIAGPLTGLGFPAGLAIGPTGP